MTHRWRFGVDRETFAEARECVRCGRVEVGYDDHDDILWLPVGEHAALRGCRQRQFAPRIATTAASLRGDA